MMVTDKMSNNQARQLCAWLVLKTLSHSVVVSIQEMASQFTDELPVYNTNSILYNKVTVKNADYQDHS